MSAETSTPLSDTFKNAQHFVVDTLDSVLGQTTGLHKEVLTYTADKSTVIENVLPEIQHSDDPHMMVDLNVVEGLANQWFSLLPRVAPFYAMKSNDDEAIIATLGNLGVGFDCASLTELDMAFRIGKATADKIIFANPCKSRSSLEYAMKMGVKKMTFDSAHELYKIKDLFPEAEVVLRVRVDDTGALCRLGSKFGALPHESDDLFAKCVELDLKLLGCSFHVGSGQEDGSRAFDRALHTIKEIYDRAEEKFGLKFTFLDIGGGFPGFDSSNVNNRFSSISETINAGLDALFPDCEVIAEPGRYFCTAPCTLLTKVISKKDILENGEKNFAYYVNEGVYGVFNNVIYDHATPKPSFDNVPEGTALYSSIIYGPTCDSVDKILEGFHMPEMHVDDFFLWKNMGAYTTCGSSTFNGFAHARRIYTYKN